MSEKSMILPYVSSLFCFLVLFLIGWSAPVFVEMFKDFQINPLPTNIKIISYIHWAWTVPLGCVIAGFIIWGSKRWAIEKRRFINTLCILLTIIVFIVYFLIAFQPQFAPSSQPSEKGAEDE